MSRPSAERENVNRRVQMRSVENSVKRQFAKVFTESDWRLFKRVADIYLRQAAFIRKRHVEAPPELKLLVRNSQKRLLIGIGVELLLKAVYLKNGYAINEPQRQNKTLKFPFTFEEAVGSQLREDRTFMLNSLIDRIGHVIDLSRKTATALLRGLTIAKVFRNKEGHVVTLRHALVLSNYRDIEFTLRELYRDGFSEALEVRFSVKPNEQPQWRITPL